MKYKQTVSYKKLWKMLIDRNMTKNDLKKAAGLKSATMSQLRRDGNVPVDVLARICYVLDCQIGDIVELIGMARSRVAINKKTGKPNLPPELQDPAGSGQLGEQAYRITELLVMAREEMPSIRVYDSENPKQFWDDLKQRELWQRAYSLRFFQNVLGIRTGAVAAEIHKRLKYFMCGDNVNCHNPPKDCCRMMNCENCKKIASCPVPKQDTIASYLRGDRRWNKRTLFLVCLALEINKGDITRAEVLFEMLGLTYARFADPVDIIYVWAIEHHYSYADLLRLFAEAKEYCVDLKFEYEEIIAKHHLDDFADLNDELVSLEREKPEKYLKNMSAEMNQKQKNAHERLDSEYRRRISVLREGISAINEETDMPLDSDMDTHELERYFRDIWTSPENILLKAISNHKDKFHYMSISRAKAIDSLLHEMEEAGKEADIKYEAMASGHAIVEREDIIKLAVECWGGDLEKINEVLSSAYFAPVGPDGRNPNDREYWASYLFEQDR